MVSGSVDVLDVANMTVSGVTGTSGQVIKSTGGGLVWGTDSDTGSPDGITLITSGSSTKYGTLLAAVAAATAGNSIQLGPGNYSASFTLPEDVTLNSPNSQAIISASNIVLSDHSRIKDLTIIAPDNGIPAILFTGSSDVHIRGITFSGGGPTSICLENSGSGKFDISHTRYDTGQCDTIFQCSTGDIEILHFTFITGTVANALHANGASVIVDGFYVLAADSSVTNGILLSSGSSVEALNLILDDVTNAIHYDGDEASLELGSSLLAATVNDILVDPLLTGTNSELHIFGGHMSRDRINFPPLFWDTANINGNFEDDREGDLATVFLGEIAVGQPERGAESIFGQGDSFVRDMLVYTSSSIGALVDVSAEAASASASTFTLPGTGSGDGLLISTTRTNSGDYYKFAGIKANTTVAMATGTGGMVAEYWTGAAWTDFATSNIQSSNPYYPYGNAMFGRAQSEQIRFDRILANGLWTANDAASLGTGTYWVRFRLTGTIDTAPIFEQFKLHTNRTELNEDGFFESFGTARAIGRLPWDIGMTEPANASPGDQDIYVSDNLNVGRVENLFNTGPTDRIGTAPVSYTHLTLPTTPYV